jgi:hypothetical protein
VVNGGVYYFALSRCAIVFNHIPHHSHLANELHPAAVAREAQQPLHGQAKRQRPVDVAEAREWLGTLNGLAGGDPLDCLGVEIGRHRPVLSPLQWALHRIVHVDPRPGHDHLVVQEQQRAATDSNNANAPETWVNL